MRIDLPPRPMAQEAVTVALDRAALIELGRAFDGELIGPLSPSYDRQRRVWNGSIDRHPALIARCESVSDVTAALRFGRRTDLPLAVRGGGHSFPGLSVCDGGLVLDLGPMKAISVDPNSGCVRAQAGVLLGELDAATQAHGLAVPLGAVSHTGVAGLTLGGGIGWLMRKHGLTIDHLRSVQVVSANGERVTASDFENPDLFWGVRGGGGNFGIVTEFEFQLNAVGPIVLAGLLAWPLEHGAEVARFYRDWAADAPDELMTALVFRRAPAIDLIPAELHGRPLVVVLCCWAGDLDRGERVLRPLRSFGSPVLDIVAPRPLVDQQSMLDASDPHGLWAYVKSCDLLELTDDVIDVALDHAERIVSPRSGVIFWQLGGAVARIGAGETAFGSRSSGHIVNITGATDDAEGFEHESGWARDYWSALVPYQAGVYVNFLMDEGEGRVRQAYGADRFDRLTALKRRYDPGNVFSAQPEHRARLTRWPPGRRAPYAPATTPA